MTYTVLARRYRSRDFDEVVGQEPIARTLQNAIGGDRTAHAYLFCGTRGVGKTSMARIFAKALNVTDDLGEAEAIAAAIFRGDDLDVIEIDGASNRGINEARDLIAGAGLSPARCRYRIYIIDEVHMLTREAFNALLKTMEEPPSHVKFILCTTEPHKVPATIQSRCQRFDFRPIATPLIVEHLRSVVAGEELAADDEVLHQVARLGHGSMRDALSLLDRLMAAGEKTLTIDLLEQMLGVPDQAAVAAVVDAIGAGDAAAALNAGNALLSSGSSVEQAMELLTEHFRTLMIISACGPESDLVELAADSRRRAVEQAAGYDTPGLVHMIALCDAVARNARGATTARSALFDALLVRLSQSAHLADVAGLLSGAAPARNHRRKKKALTSSAQAELKPAKAPAPQAPSPRPQASPKPQDPSALPDGPALWQQTVAAAAGSPGDQARIEHLKFEKLDGRRMHLSIVDAEPALARVIVKQAEAVAELVRRSTGQAVDVRIDIGVEAAVAPGAAPPPSVAEVQALPEVARVMDLFDATIVAVREDEPKKEQEENDV